MTLSPLSHLQSRALPRAVLFDWDNTLVDSWRTCFHAINATLTHHDMPNLTEAELLQRPQTSLRDSFPKMFGEAWEKAAEHYHSVYLDIHLKHLKLLTGSRELVEKLHENGVYMAVVSNKTGLHLRKEVEFLQWNRYFAAIVGSCDLSSDKPSPLPARYALEQGGHEAGKDVFFIGDSAVDIECARSTGCTPVLVRPLAGQTIEGDDIHRFENCLEIARFWNLVD